MRYSPIRKCGQSMIVESQCLKTRAADTVVILMDTISSSDTLHTEVVAIEVEGNACTSDFSSLYCRLQ